MGLVKNIISWFKKTDDNELINKENTNHAITLEQEIADEQSGNTDSTISASPSDFLDVSV